MNPDQRQYVISSLLIYTNLQNGWMLTFAMPFITSDPAVLACIDPEAANIVFDSGIPFVLVLLDATDIMPVTRRFNNALGDHPNTPSVNLVHYILTANLDFVDSGSFQFWVSLTSGILADESIVKFEEIQLRVVEDEGPETTIPNRTSTVQRSE